MLPAGEDGSGFVVRHVEADFLGMAKLGDLLEVRTRLLDEKRSGVRLRQEIVRDEERIFTMEVQLVYVVRGRPKRIPPELLEIIRAL